MIRRKSKSNWSFQESNTYLCDMTGEPFIKKVYSTAPERLASFTGSGTGKRRLLFAIRNCSSWPLSTVSHHSVVTCCAGKVYSGQTFSRYAILRDDVSADTKVAEVYRNALKT